MTENAELDDQSPQAEIIAFLRHPQSYGLPDGTPIEQISTHISHVFLAGSRAYKLKRAVRLPYVDFSSLAERKAACAREVRLNRRTAPQLYLGAVAVRQGTNGNLRIGGRGQAIEWLVEMAAFDPSRTLDKVAERGALGPAISRALGDAVADLHEAARISRTAGRPGAIIKIIAGNDRAFALCPRAAFPPDVILDLSRSCYRGLDEIAGLLERRRKRGEVRRGHGDLHLANVCLIDELPVLFDCLEFDEDLATTDVLYDVGFLLMDLVGHRLDEDANAVFNRYLDRRNQTDGLAALPLFMALRAAIRAHVTALRGPNAYGAARAYARLALKLLQPKPPRLLAVAGLSGSGKSTIAYRLAPGIGVLPGARVIRSDVIRKSMFGVAPETRLPQDAYTPVVTERVYRQMAENAAATLAAGHSVVVDAVFLRPGEREAIAEVAAKAAIPFKGLWLDAPAEILERRIAERANDASDADAGVMRRQAELDPGAITWAKVDVSGTIERAAEAAWKIVA